MAASPPSHSGKKRLIPIPVMPHKIPNIPTATNACRKIPRARCMSPAPKACATCTEKPVAAAEHNPLKSHVVVDTKPIDAEAFAPKLPTIAASMYCMTIEDNCAMIAGTLSCKVSLNCSPNVIKRPSRTRANKSYEAIIFITKISGYKNTTLSSPLHNPYHR